MSITATVYNPSDWYWMIGSDDQNVWSSARYTLVPIADAAYVAWLATYYQPTPIPSMAELTQVLATQYPAGILQTYNGYIRWQRRNAGVIISSLSPVAFMSDEASVNDINSSYNYGQANLGATFQWKMSDGSFVPLNNQQIATLHNNVLNFVQSCFELENTNLAAINGGTITTLTQIDDAFAAISNVFP